MSSHYFLRALLKANRSHSKLLVGGGTQNLLITGLFGAEKLQVFPVPFEHHSANKSHSIMVGVYILFFSERWGRKPTLWVAALLMAMCFIVVTIVNKTTPAPDPNTDSASSAGIATVAMIFLTNSIYQFSWGPLPWPYAAEVSGITIARHANTTDNPLPRSSPRASVRSAPQSESARSGCLTSCTRSSRRT